MNYCNKSNRLFHCERKQQPTFGVIFYFSVYFLCFVFLQEWLKGRQVSICITKQSNWLKNTNLKQNIWKCSRTFVAFKFKDDRLSKTKKNQRKWIANELQNNGHKKSFSSKQYTIWERERERGLQQRNTHFPMNNNNNGTTGQNVFYELFSFICIWTSTACL